MANVLTKPSLFRFAKRFSLDPAEHLCFCFTSAAINVMPEAGGGTRDEVQTLHDFDSLCPPHVGNFSKNLNTNVGPTIGTFEQC